MTASAVNVLLLEDSPADARLLEVQLRGQPYRLDVVRRLSEAVPRLQSHRYSLVIVDLGLPDSTGIDTVARVHELVPSAPIMVLTNDQDSDMGLSAVQAGAQDFLNKGASTALLTRTMRYAIERKHAEVLRARLVHADRLSSVGQLAASVAHEVNNPNAYVFGNLHLLKESIEHWDIAPEDKADALELIADCLDGVQRVTRIVRQLSSFARVDDERSEPVAINDVLRDAVALVTNDLRHKARLDVDLADGLLPFAGNPPRLVQVFTNLMINAAQAFPDDGADDRCIQVRSYAQEDMVIAEVLDNGAGIPDEIKERLKEPFFTTKPAGVGTGLGLAICTEIVERHHGTLELNNRPDGPGAVARVSIPVVRAPKAPPRPRAATLPRLPAVAPLRVLLIDDDQAVRRAFSRVIAGAGHEVTAAATAREALAVLRDREVDGVLCDLEMPKMDGAAFYQQLSTVSPVHCGRVVFCTGGAFTPRAKKFVEDNQAPCLQKPLDIELLGQALTYWDQQRNKRAS